jgi:hypothetical protein
MPHPSHEMASEPNFLLPTAILYLPRTVAPTIWKGNRQTAWLLVNRDAVL